MSDHLITDAAELQALCTQLARAPWIALDTEFMRVNTYRARLCLVQLATPETIACIDPLVLNDIGSLLELLYLPGVEKVLHAARQDLEVFADIRRIPPRPVFDTQIAAAFLGYDDQIGYAALVEKLTGHTLDKIAARTDWAARPLSAQQLRYAADDVRYLRDIYLTLNTHLEQLGRRDWLAQECAALTEPALYDNDPEQAWRRLGAGATLAPVQQTLLVALARWREQEAAQRDLPRGWVVPDAALVEIARRQPDSVATLAEIPGLKPAMLRRDGANLLQLVAQAPTLAPQRHWEASERLDAAQTAQVKRLGGLVQDKARAAQISPTLVATRRELVRLVRGDPGCALLRGWRRQFIGEELLAQS